MLGVAISTVDGRLTIIGLIRVAPQVSATAVQISTAKSSSVPVKLSGEYSKVTSASRSARPCFHQPSAPHRQIDDSLSIHTEDHPALQLRGGVVEMEDHARRTLQRLDGSLDQLRPRLTEHLDR